MIHHSFKGFTGDSVLKNPAAMQEPWVQSLGWEDPLEKEMTTHSSIFVWKIPWVEEPGRLHIVHGVARVRHNLVTKPPAPKKTYRCPTVHAEVLNMLVVREMQIKTTVRYHLTPVRMAIIKKSTNNKY